MLLAASALPPLTPRPASKLHLEEYVAPDSTAFHVVSTLIVGPTEVLLWDAQYHASDARRLADRIAATGKHLKAIVISHPDHDHYMGTAAVLERFPGTPVYMTAAAIQEYQKTSGRYLQMEKTRLGAEAPDSLVTPQILPSLHLTVDGEDVQVIPDLTGDVITPTNSSLWIPSLSAVLAADVAFDGIHPWLGSSDEASRTAWRASLKRLGELHPKTVVPGHKDKANAPDSPAVLTFMDRYLADFETTRKASDNAAALIATMQQKYPQLTVRMLLTWSAQMAFRKPPAS
jgi:glyoxylase-like metal-dependent hydrolase (beta-lactamase superfamily II)